MRILAIDDEEIALRGLVRSIEKAAPDAEVAGFQRPEDAIHYLEESRPDVIFTDIQMLGTDGLTFARMVKARFDEVDIVFASGFSEYMPEAFDLYASGYLIKPITPEKVRSALENLRYHRPEAQNRLEVRCFGDFEVFFGGKPVPFKLRRTKELLAYLVDRRGALCTVQQVSSVLFEDDNHEAYVYKLRNDLVMTLQSIGCDDAIVRQYGQMGILPDQVKCDYYRYLDHPETGGFRGEYMSQFSWGEFTLATLLEHRSGRN